jgi:hypothetical protein
MGRNIMPRRKFTKRHGILNFLQLMLYFFGNIVIIYNNSSHIVRLAENWSNWKIHNAWL